MRVTILILILCAIPKIAYSATLIFGPVIGTEEVNNNVSGNVYSFRSLYRRDSGITLGAVAQFGAIHSADSDQVPDENRFEAIVGYMTTLPYSKISPYVFLSKGLRKFSDKKTNVDYHTVTFGGTYRVTEKVYLDGYYKYRNTHDINWQANIFSTGLGFDLSPQLSLQINLGRTRGDYDSQFYNLAFTRRF